MDYGDTSLATRNERLASIVERCLESRAAYKLFDLLASIAELEPEAKIEYMAMVRESGVYNDEDIEAIERLIISGAAQYFKSVMDQVRDEQIQRKIDQMLAS